MGRVVREERGGKEWRGEWVREEWKSEGKRRVGDGEGSG